MGSRITDMQVTDLRFPTSRTLAGSDAMNLDPDYSATYVTLTTDGDDAPGHGLTFTIGRGNEIVVTAVEALRSRIVGTDLDDAAADMGAFWRHLGGDSQIRWIGPDKGAVHLALAAVVNAFWDLLAKRAGKPLWKLLVDMPPQELVRAMDLTGLHDELPPEAALELLERNAAGRADRERHLLQAGYPAYITSAGWLGYDDQQVRSLAAEAMDAGWSRFKMKVGADLDDDLRRARMLRSIIGPDRDLMLDANQRWEVDEAIEWMAVLAEVSPRWIEEPVHPDDVLGHATVARAIAPIGVATGEHAANRYMFKQLLQAEAIAYAQIDACRLGGVNEVLSVILMAGRRGIPVNPHAGGVGLCEYVQHLSAFDHIAVGGSLEGRMTEYADHLHEHFVDPVRVRSGNYVLPERPGYSAEIHQSSIERFRFPDGPEWKGN